MELLSIGTYSTYLPRLPFSARLFFLLMVIVLFGIVFISQSEYSRINNAAREGNDCSCQSRISSYDPGLNIFYDLCITNDTCEDGLPHTSDENTVVIPASIAGGKHGARILKHELIHILQRRHKKHWDEFYEKEWQFTVHETPPSGLPSWISQRRRRNPDLLDSHFSCWANRWWPVTVYNSRDLPELREATVLWWDSEKNVVLQEEPVEFVSFFGKVSQNEHPNEIAAVYLEEQGIKRGSISKAANKLFSWKKTRTAFWA